MPRPYPDRRRRRPGRRPPHRYRGGMTPPQAHGFTGPGFRAAYDLILPLRVRERRAYFNRAAAILALAAGYAAALQGYRWAGPVGAITGLGFGLAVAGGFLERRGFSRR